MKTFKGGDPEARRKSALQDPEIQQILGDPAMQMILQQMQSNPEALREYVYLVHLGCVNYVQLSGFDLQTPSKS